MPGEISRSYEGPPDDAPYVPSWCYPDGKPHMCPCGHHEGYHNDGGEWASDQAFKMLEHIDRPVSAAAA